MSVELQRLIHRNAAAFLRKEFREVLRKAVKMSAVDSTPCDDFARALATLQISLDTRLDELFDHWESRRGNYLPLFTIAPARRARKTKAGKPMTLVERRASAAHRKVVEWQRKQKLAATKIKAYRRKVKYYTKKGVIR